MSDDLDGCELDFIEDPTPDDDLDAVTLFVDVAGDPDAVAIRAAEYKQLFG